MTYINCPFCNEQDFDLVGLKTHLTKGYCETYENTLSFEEELERRKEERKKLEDNHE